MAEIDRPNSKPEARGRSWALLIIVIAVTILALFIAVNGIGIVDASSPDTQSISGTENAADTAPVGSRP